MGIQKHQQLPERVAEIERGFTISGKIKYQKDESPVALSRVFLSSKESGFHSAITDNAGKFTFKNIYFTDSTNLVFKLETKQKKKKLQFDQHT